MSDSWVLKINDGVCEIDSFDKAVEIILDELDEYFDIKQCFYHRIPFSIGAIVSCLYDGNEITDEQIVVYERMGTLMYRILYYDALEFIKHNYSMHYEDEYIYDLNILKKEDEIVASMTADCKEFKDYLETNMFTLDPNKEYYFRSSQRVVVYSDGDRYHLGYEAKLDISLKKK